VKPVVEKKPEGAQPLKGEVVLFTGGLETMTRPEAQRRAESAGAQTAAGISKKVTLVVAGAGWQARPAAGGWPRSIPAARRSKRQGAACGRGTAGDALGSTRKGAADPDPGTQESTAGPGAQEAQGRGGQQGRKSLTPDPRLGPCGPPARRRPA